jgi:hypothetical protein
MDSQACRDARDEDLERISGFRQGLYECFSRRADVLFELTDAVLCASGPVRSLVGLSTEKVFRRGHGALYDALACGDVDVESLRALIAGSWTPTDTGPVKIAIDVSAWLRPDAECTSERCHAHVCCRCDGKRKTAPGWPYSIAAGLEWGASSWTAPLDAVRVRPDDDATLVALDQIERVMGMLKNAGTLAGRGEPVFVFDSGYDMTRISYLCAQRDLDVQILGRVRSNRMYYRRSPSQRRAGQIGRTARHGTPFDLDVPATWGPPEQQLSAHNPRYGTVRVRAWSGLHQKLSRRAGWAHHVGPLPIVEGTLILIQVERLPGDRTPKDMWLWHTTSTDTAFDLDLLWKTYLRRFDLEHTFRFVKQHLGWTTPQICTPAQGDRWTWLILAAHTQLRLARTLSTDLRRPWEKPTPTGRPMTPGRVRRGFPALRRKLPNPTRTPKPTRPGPGRPKGTTRPPRPRYPVGKNHHRPDTARSKETNTPG